MTINPSELNESLMKKNSAENAAKIIKVADKIQEILQIFWEIDPYVQCVLISSVVELKSSEFESIEPYYRNLIHLAQQSSDEWVKQISSVFRDYPSISQIDSFPNFSPKSVDFEYYDPFEEAKYEEPKSHFVLDPSFKREPPSARLKPKAMGSTESNVRRAEPKLFIQQSTVAPVIPRNTQPKKINSKIID